MLASVRLSHKLFHFVHESDIAYHKVTTVTVTISVIFYGNTSAKSFSNLPTGQREAIYLLKFSCYILQLDPQILRI